MAAFSSVQSIATATYPSTPQVVINVFQPKRIVVQNVDAAAVVFVSFDGVNDHASLLNNPASTMSQQEWWFQMAQKVWLRTAAGVATQVQVIAEG